MNSLGPFYQIAAALLALMLGACAGYDPRLNNREVKYLGTGGPVIDPATKESLALKKSYWDDSGITGSSFHRHQSEQANRLLLQGRANLSASRQFPADEKASTRLPGNYKILQKDLNHASNLYGDYVDAAGNVVVEERGRKKRSRPARA